MAPTSKKNKGGSLTASALTTALLLATEEAWRRSMNVSSENKLKNMSSRFKKGGNDEPSVESPFFDQPQQGGKKYHKKGGNFKEANGTMAVGDLSVPGGYPNSPVTIAGNNGKSMDNLTGIPQIGGKKGRKQRRRGGDGEPPVESFVDQQPPPPPPPPPPSSSVTSIPLPGNGANSSPLPINITVNELGNNGQNTPLAPGQKGGKGRKTRKGGEEEKLEQLNSIQGFAIEDILKGGKGRKTRKGGEELTEQEKVNKQIADSLVAQLGGKGRKYGGFFGYPSSSSAEDAQNETDMDETDIILINNRVEQLMKLTPQPTYEDAIAQAKSELGFNGGKGRRGRKAGKRGGEGEVQVVPQLPQVPQVPEGAKPGLPLPTEPPQAGGKAGKGRKASKKGGEYASVSSEYTLGVQAPVQHKGGKTKKK